MDHHLIRSATLTISGSGTIRPAADAPTTQRTADGNVRFENENYRITAGDDDQVLIQNRNTGEQYRIWGDPHVEVDGRQAFDFWGQTTFILDDGTKVTIETTPWNEGKNGATIASKVTITDGEYTAEISGVDTNTRGDLEFREFHGVHAPVHELATRAGNVLYENDKGAGFVALDRNGDLVGAVQITDRHEVLLISDGGTLVRTRAAEVSVVSRNTQGVTLIRLGEGERLQAIERVDGSIGDDEGDGDENAGITLDAGVATSGGDPAPGAAEAD